MAMSFLGHILDSIMRQEICVPPEKVAELMHELDSWSTRHKATKHEPLSLLGKLFFAARVVPVVPASPHHTCINCGTPAPSDLPEC